MESFEEFKAEFLLCDIDQVIKRFYEEKIRLLEIIRSLNKRNDELAAEIKETEKELNTVVEENEKIKKHIANLKDAFNFLSAEIE